MLLCFAQAPTPTLYKSEFCADALCALVNKGTTHVVLAHLSQENNTPHLAYDTSVTTLRDMGALENRDYLLKIAEPENTGGIITL